MSDPKPHDVPNPETGTDPSRAPDENPTSLECADDEGGTRANEPRSDVL